MKLKKIFILLFGLQIVLFNSCDSLDLYPEDIYGINDYWTTQSQIDRFMSGLHNRLRGRKTNLIRMGELRGNYMKPDTESTTGQGKSDLPIVSHNLSAANAGLSNFADFYMDIMQMNHAISQINNHVDFLSDNDKNYYLGMLHGLRSFYYFHMLRTWGGMPIVDEPEVLGVYNDVKDLNKARSTERETYEFVLKDINKSLEYFKNDNFTQKSAYKTCFWTKQATYMLKAEINMWGAKVEPIGEDKVFSSQPTEDLQEARDLLLEIKNMTSLEPDLATLYQVKDNQEIIFAIRYALNEATNGFSDFIYAPATFGSEWTDLKGNSIGNDPLTATGGFFRYEYKIDLFDKFEATDKRRDFTFMYFGKEVWGGGRPPVLLEQIRAVCMRKFLGNTFSDAGKTNRVYVDDFPIYRKADLLLMLAEIYNDLDDAANTKLCLEEVRRRAYGDKFGDDQKFTYVDHDSTEEAILLERDKEFVAEGKRWYDIRRMLHAKYAIATCKNADERRILWPIAAGELADDPLLKQNDAYINN